MRPRQPHEELRTLPFLALRPKRATHLVDQRAADGEAEAGAAILAGGRLLELTELVKDGLQLIGRDSRAFVGDLQHDVTVLVPPAEPHPAAGGRELHRVGDQVDDDLLQPVGVRLHSKGRRFLGQLDRDLSLLGEGANRLDSTSRRVVQRNGTELHRHPPALDAREVQQIVDEANQAIEVAQRDIEQVIHLLGDRARRALPQQAERRLDRGQRRAQLVAHHRDELALRRLRLRLLCHVAIDNQVAQLLEVGAMHRQHGALTDQPPRERELHPIAQRAGFAAQRRHLRVQCLGIDHRAGQYLVDVVQGRADDDLLGQAHQLAHRPIGVSDPAAAHHHHTRIAGVDQRDQAPALRLGMRVLNHQRLALLIDGGQQLGVVERRRDLAGQQHGQLEVLVLVTIRFRRAEVQRADHFVVQVDGNDQGGDGLLSRRADAFGAAEAVDPDCLARLDRLAGEAAIDRIRGFLLHKAAAGRVEERMQMVVGAVLGQEHHAGTPELEDTLDLQDGGAKDLVQVERSVDQRRQLADHLQALRPYIPGAQFAGPLHHAPLSASAMKRSVSALRSSSCSRAPGISSGSTASASNQRRPRLDSSTAGSTSA